jgi:hypothetical protein
VLIPLQLLAVLILADLSYRFVELPFRGGAKLPGLPENWLRVGRPALLVAVVAVVALVGWSGLFGGGRSSPAPAAASTASYAKVVAKPLPSEPRDETNPGAKAGTATEPPRIVALGDSVMIGARDRLAARLGPGFSMSARVGRQADEFVAIVQRLRRQGHSPDAMIIQMGNNGPLYGEQMEAIERATSNVGHLFLINDHAPVSWVEESNDALAEAGRDWPHTTVIDWKSAAESGQGLLWDEIHLTPAGAAAYARLVAAAVREEVPFPRRGSERG